MRELTTAGRGNKLLKKYQGFRSDGKQIIDELCECGHYISQHSERFGLGHGICSKCDCRQFTWAKFVTA